MRNKLPDSFYICAWFYQDRLAFVSTCSQCNYTVCNE